MAHFCFRACSSEASLERRGDRRKRSLLCLSPSPAAVDAASGEGRPFSRGLPGHGLGQHRAGLLCPQPAPEYPDTDLPGGTGHGIRVWCWDVEAGGGSTLVLPTRALHDPGVRVSVIYQLIPLTPQQLHLRAQKGSGCCGLRGRGPRPGQSRGWGQRQMGTAAGTGTRVEWEVLG